MKMMPRFSVCIPNYNLGHFIGETIQSVLDQTFSDFEIIIVDNASTDDSVNVIESFEDDRIRLYQNNYNIGFSPNLQAVTQRATGEFLILLSSDDLMAPNALEQYDQVLKEQGGRAQQTVLCAATQMVDENNQVSLVCVRPSGDIIPKWVPEGEINTIPLKRKDQISGRAALRTSLFNCSSLATFCSTAYPRSMWEKVQGYDTTYSYFPDNVFLYKLLLSDPDFIWINEPLFSYRVHSSNQDALAAKQSAIKYQVDGYMQTVAYPNENLYLLGLSRDDLVRSFLKVVCIDDSLGKLTRGAWVQALKIFLFAFATYPGRALKIPKTYAALFLLALGPLGIQLAKLARKVFIDT